MNRIIRLAVSASLLALLWPHSQAEAQWRPIYPGYPAYRYAEPESDLKINVSPKDASVFVDGYFAGEVDEFDGPFQRLHLTPGQHDIVIYLEGFRSLHQKLYLSPRQTRTIAGTLDRLAPGEAPEPVPVPTDRPDPNDPYSTQPPRGAVTRPGPGLPRDRIPQPGDPRGPGGDNRDSRSGALSIRVQPNGSTVLIDGERWSGPSGNERLIVQVAEGRHTVEVQGDGLAPFVTEVDVRRGQTIPVNISLTRAP